MPGRAALGHCWVEQPQLPPPLALGLGRLERRAQFCIGCSLPSLFVIFGLKGYVAERKGEREEMADAHVILNDITAECQPLHSHVSVLPGSPGGVEVHSDAGAVARAQKETKTAEGRRGVFSGAVRQ